MFQEAAVDGHGLGRNGFAAIKMAQDAAAHGAGQLGCADENGGADIADRPHLIGPHDALPQLAHLEPALQIIVAADDVIHSGCGKHRELASLEIRQQGLPEDFRCIGTACHLFHPMLTGLGRQGVDRLVPAIAYEAAIVAGFQIDDHIPGRLIVAGVEARPADEAQADPFQRIRCRQQQGRRVIDQGHRFDSPKALTGQGLFEHGVDPFAFHTGNGNFFRPRQEPAIAQVLPLYSKGKGMAQGIGLLPMGDLTDEAGQEIEKLPSRRRRREIVVLARQPERLADLLFDEVTVPAQQADPRSPCVRTAEIQGQIDAVLITARQGNMRLQGRYGRPGLAAQGPFHIGGKIAGNLLQPLVGQIKIAGNIHPVHPFFHGSDHTSRKIITLLYYSFSAFVVFPCHFSQASSLSTVDFL